MGDGEYMEEFDAKPVDPQEIKNVLSEIKKTQNEIKKIQASLKKLPATDESRSELIATANDLYTQAVEHYSAIQTAPKIEQQDALQDYYGARLWDSVNELRGQFVDPQEIKNVLREIKSMQADLKRFLTQAAKIKGNDTIVEQIKTLQGEVAPFYSNISKAPMNEVRDAIQEFHDAQLWESINPIRARVELPKEVKSIASDLKIIQKMPSQKKYKNTGVDWEQYKINVNEIASVYAEIKSAMDQGDWDSAWEVLEWEVHQGGKHPGEVRHTMDRLADIRNRIKPIKDADVRGQVEEVINSIVAVFNEGDFRTAREAMDQFLNQAQQLEKYFRSYQSGRNDALDEKIGSLMEKLGTTVQQKLDNPKPEMEKKADELMPAEPMKPPQLETVQ